MRTPRQISVHRAVLQALANVPVGYLLTETMLKADASRQVLPRPTSSEIDAEIRHADVISRIQGIDTEEGIKWQITDAGRLWLANNP